MALEERKVFEQEKVSLLSKLTLMQAKLNIAVKSSNDTSSQTLPGGTDAPAALPVVETTDVEAGDSARQGSTSSLAEDLEASSLQVSKVLLFGLILPCSIVLSLDCALNFLGSILSLLCM